MGSNHRRVTRPVGENSLPQNGWLPSSPANQTILFTIPCPIAGTRSPRPAVGVQPGARTASVKSPASRTIRSSRPGLSMPDSRYPFSPTRGWGSTQCPDSLGQVLGLQSSQKFPAGVVHARQPVAVGNHHRLKQISHITGIAEILTCPG